MKDQVNHPDLDRVSSLAFGLIERLQDSPRGEQLSAASIVFLLFCDVLEARPGDLYDNAARLLADPRKGHAKARFQAIRKTIEEQTTPL